MPPRVEAPLVAIRLSASQIEVRANSGLSYPPALGEQITPHWVSRASMPTFARINLLWTS